MCIILAVICHNNATEQITSLLIKHICRLTDLVDQDCTWLGISSDLHWAIAVSLFQMTLILLLGPVGWPGYVLFMGMAEEKMQTNPIMQVLFKTLLCHNCYQSHWSSQGRKWHTSQNKKAPYTEGESIHFLLQLYLYTEDDSRSLSSFPNVLVSSMRIPSCVRDFYQILDAVQRIFCSSPNITFTTQKS